MNRMKKDVNMVVVPKVENKVVKVVDWNETENLVITDGMATLVPKD